MNGLFTKYHTDVLVLEKLHSMFCRVHTWRFWVASGGWLHRHRTWTLGHVSYPFVSSLLPTAALNNLGHLAKQLEVGEELPDFTSVR